MTITYHNASKDARENRSDHREDGRDKSHAEKAEKNSAQRRSEARAKKYYSAKRSATSDNQTTPSEAEGAREGAHDDDVAMTDTSGSGRGRNSAMTDTPRSRRARDQ